MGYVLLKTLYREVKDSIQEHNVPIEDAIKVITSNVAKFLKLHNKGKIEAGRDADFVIVSKESLDINMVIAKGKIVVEDGKAAIKPTFQ